MPRILWRGTVFSLLILLSLSACAGGTAAPDSTETPAAKATVAFIFPTETGQPTATALPEGPITWSGGQRPLLMAHYMPWYQTPDGHGSWGWHWTMNRFSPKQAADGSWSDLASHYTPLTGPYDSSDPAVLEYQALLMKLSGIDGVIIDWYGMESFWDYGTLNESTARVIEAMQKAGLKVVICYEDQSVKHMVENNHLKQEDAVAHGQEVMRYLQENWFGQEAYLKVNGHPVLFTFGPQYFNSKQWSELFSVLETMPKFITLDGKGAIVDGGASLANGAFAGGFPWPPMWASTAGVLTNERLASYLDEFYDRSAKWDYRVGGAFPGFKDIYKEAGQGNGYGLLEANDGQTLRFTLQSALNAQPEMIQLVTWNDYGEGTIIEPTVETGYAYLEIVQEARKATEAGFTFTAQDLRLPFELYTQRLQAAGDSARLALLDQAGQDLAAGRLDEARRVLLP